MAPRKYLLQLVTKNIFQTGTKWLRAKELYVKLYKIIPAKILETTF